jgi:GT2 family glycosyltransferase
VNGTENDLWIVIPTANRHQYLEDIFKNSGVPRNQIVLVRTTSGEDIPKVHNIWDLDDFNIHRWWNKGINFAEEHGAKFVAVLNDDVWIEPQSLQKIVFCMKDSIEAVIGYPEPCSSDICGYAWVLRLDSPVRPDERYRWWFGDNDLRNQARLHGGYVKVPCDIRHLHPNETTIGKFFEATKRDGELFYEKWDTTSRD